MEQDTIDLGQVWQLAKQHKTKLIQIIALFVVAALALAFILPEKFESSVLMRAKNNQQGGVSLQASAALALLGGSSTAPLQSYQELIKSRSVLEPVIAKLDLPAEVKEKMTNELFAKQYLQINNPKGTDLLRVTATGRSPEEAQTIATNVMNSFQQELTTLNQTQQSLNMKFLAERLMIAKQEMEQAEAAAEVFRQQTKLYIPDEQTKGIVTALSEFDQRLAQLQIAEFTNQAKLQAVLAQLEQQHVAMETFNMVENEVLAKIKGEIIDKQMKLVALQQRYQDKHPSVILAKEELVKLNKTLQQEIMDAIKSGVAILNPVQGTLLAEKVVLEMALATNQATAQSVRQVHAEAEQKLSHLSNQGLDYIRLQRQVQVTREVYSVLIRNYEQARIQETMESMDVQVVDQPNLPQVRSEPRRSLIVIVGGVVGGMASTIYLLIAYTRVARKPFNV